MKQRVGMERGGREARMRGGSPAYRVASWLGFGLLAGRVTASCRSAKEPRARPPQPAHYRPPEPWVRARSVTGPLPPWPPSPPALPLPLSPPGVRESSGAAGSQQTPDPMDAHVATLARSLSLPRPGMATAR